MPAPYEHVVITRFSAVFVDGWQPMPEEWLRYRLNFFAAACYPAMLGQTTRDFRWWVYLDDRCTAEFRREIEVLAEDVFEPIWTHENFWTRHRQDLADRCTTPYLITTRLDSDDALARDFVESVQRQFDGQERLAVNFARGLELDRSGAVFRRDWASNNTISLIERRSASLPLGAFARPHHEMRCVAPLREVRTSTPMRLVIIHGSNVTNAVRGVRVHPRWVTGHFDLELPLDEHASGGALVVGRLRSAARAWRTRLTRPVELAWWAQAFADRLRGTHDKPQGRPVLMRLHEATRGRSFRSRTKESEPLARP